MIRCNLTTKYYYLISLYIPLIILDSPLFRFQGINRNIPNEGSMTLVYRDSCVQALERYVVVDSPNNISGSLTGVLEVHQCNVGYFGYRINRYL